jgi:hypothetical protein
MHPTTLRIILTLAAIALAIVHAKWATAITIDGVTLGLIALAVVPWLAPIIKSIELPGVGKIELQEVRAQVEDLRGEAASASQKADTALATKSAWSSAFPGQPPAPVSAEGFVALATKYDHIRKAQKPGGLRTAAMTDVVGEMIALAPTFPTENVAPFLSDKDGGKRLFAYAYLYARPNPQHLADLVHSVTEIENKPFGQYWGIQAIGRVIQANPDSVDTQIRNTLRKFLGTLEKGTDRYFELSKIMSALDNSA